MTDWLGMASRPKAPRPELKAEVLARALRSRQRLVVWAYAGAAALVMTALGTGAWARWRIRGLEQTRVAFERRVDALRDTLDLVRGRHTRMVQIPVTTGGRLGSVTIFEDTLSRRWLVRCENLAPNEPDRAYQLWFVTDAGLISASLMPMDGDEPMIMVLEMPGDTMRVRGAAMSIEPRAGSTEIRGPTVFRQLL